MSDMDNDTRFRKEKPVRVRAKRVQPREKAILLRMMGGDILVRHDHFPFDSTYTIGKAGESEAARDKVDVDLVALMVTKRLLWAPQPPVRGDVSYTRTDIAQEAAVQNWVLQPGQDLPDLFLDG